MEVELGRKAKDTISGFTGIVTAISEYLNGCRRICLSPKVKKDGDLPDSCWFDEPQLKILRGGVRRGDKNTGGPAHSIAPEKTDIRI